MTQKSKGWLLAAMLTALGLTALGLAEPALGRDEDVLFATAELATLGMAAQHSPLYWHDDHSPVPTDSAWGLRARARFASMDAGLRLDLASQPTDHHYARLMTEVYSRYAAGGLGLGLLPVGRNDTAVRLPLWLQVGTADVHVRARLRDGGPLVDSRDLAGLTVGTRQTLASWRLAGDLGWSSTTVGSGPEVALSAGYSHVSALLQVRQLGETDHGARVWQVGLAVQVDFSVAIAGETAPYVAEVLTAAETATPEQMAQVLQPGTLFELGTKATGPGATAPLTSVCMADEVTQAGDETWYHLNCEPELPSSSPPTWRSGCYVVRPEGIWRMPACPGESRPSGARAELLVPAKTSAASSRFIDLGASAALPRKFRIGDATVSATCTLHATDRVSEACYVPNYGLVWSAWYWPKRGGGGGAASAVKLLRVSRDMPVDSEAPHLRGLRNDSARCLFGASCAMFGQCSVRSGTCVALSRADCGQSAVCARWGRCTASQGACVTGGTADCATSSSCKENGACTADNGRCVARGDNCTATAGCRLLGRCTPVAGRCRLASDGDCQRSQPCQNEGLCHLRGETCWANDDQDCAGSEACSSFGECRAEGGRCVGGKGEAP